MVMVRIDGGSDGGSVVYYYQLSPALNTTRPQQTAHLYALTDICLFYQCVLTSNYQKRLSCKIIKKGYHATSLQAP